MSAAASAKPPMTVVFRVWRKTGGVVALFPDVPFGVHEPLTLAYDRGDFTGVDYSYTMDRTRRATDDEAATTLERLRHMGYTLRPLEARQPRKRAAGMEDV